MAYWVCEKMKLARPETAIIDPFDEKAARHGAYELPLSLEALVASNKNKGKSTLKLGEQFGQI
jgi:hypothetical protein